MKCLNTESIKCYVLLLTHFSLTHTPPCWRKILFFIKEWEYDLQDKLYTGIKCGVHPHHLISPNLKLKTIRRQYTTLLKLLRIAHLYRPTCCKKCGKIYLPACLDPKLMMLNTDHPAYSFRILFHSCCKYSKGSYVEVCLISLKRGMQK